MMLWSGTLAVLRYQLRQSLTWKRGAGWFFLVAFAPLTIGLLRFGTDAKVPPEAWSFILYGLIACVTCMLGAYLWATPVLAGELENQTWYFTATRPMGLYSILLGNYVAGILWTVSAALAALAISLLLLPVTNRTSLIATFVPLIPCSVVAYAGVFLAIGAIALRRSMLIAVGYVLLVEIVLTFVPALANRLTIQFRLRTLWVHWMDWKSRPPGFDGPMELFGNPASFEHVAWLIGTATVGVALALVCVRLREISATAETEF